MGGAVRKAIEMVIIEAFSIISMVCFGIFIFCFSVLSFLAISDIYFSNKKKDKAFKAWLQANHGKNFFCYNERRKARPYIEEIILPALNKNIEIVYLENRQVQSQSNPNLVSDALYQLKNYKKFPHLMKIRHGELIDESILNTFYNAKNGTCSKEILLEEIHSFYQK